MICIQYFGSISPRKKKYLNIIQAMTSINKNINEKIEEKNQIKKYQLSRVSN